jgi:hypothetical protein
LPERRALQRQVAEQDVPRAVGIAPAPVAARPARKRRRAAKVVLYDPAPPARLARVYLVRDDHVAPRLLARLGVVSAEGPIDGHV